MTSRSMQYLIWSSDTMIALSVNDITKTYGTDVILDRISFHINTGDRIGIVGVNGAGKSTLLGILTGETECDAGGVYISDSMRVGYLRQDDGFDPENTVMQQAEKVFAELHAMEEEMSALLERMETGDGDVDLLEKYDRLQERYKDAGGYTYKSEMNGMLMSMGFSEEDLKKRISSLSGGERTRLALTCLLLEKPDILFLDEPTNHLDISTLNWLGQYLRGYKGTMVLVSHDRYFLDETVTRIFEIEGHRLSVYEGNYTFYAAEKRKRRESELRKYEKQQKEIRRQEEMIRRFKQHGTEKLAKRAASREKMLEKTEAMERPISGSGRMKLDFREDFRSGRDVIYAEGLSKSFGYGSGAKELFRNVSLDIKRGERVCIVGDNGIGKTTLLRMLLGEVPANSGRIRTGHNVKMGYYDQGQRLLTDTNTVIDELHDAYRSYTDGELRNILGRFLFRGDAVFLEVGSLSGGERARLALLKLMLSGANTLILDEPTNHLDIESKEVFEEALLDFPGTCLIVSHDRYFLNRVPTRIMELTQDGMEVYQGRYDYYVEKKQQLGRSESDASASGTGGAKASGEGRSSEDEGMSSAERRRLQKEREADERRLRRKKEALEKAIAELEESASGLEDDLRKEENMKDPARLAEIGQKLVDIRADLDEKYEEWLVLQEE